MTKDKNNNIPPVFLKETELIAACSKNNRKAQSELFRRYKDTLFLTSLKYCRNETDAEDNLHDAFVSIFTSIKKYKGKGSFEGWMRRITINKAIDKYKIKKPYPVEIKNDILADNHTLDFNASPLSLDQILSCVQELPDQYRIVFSMYQLDGFTHREIAQTLGIVEGTSKSNYHRAKSLLKESLLKITNLPEYHKTQSHGA